jgi:predicted nucleic acid-binding protein
MPVVSNTSPISNLAIIGRLDLLRTRFEQSWIPGAVENELRRLPNVAALSFIEDALQQGWMIVRPVPDNPIVRLLTAKLHRGEAEAITLAVEMSASCVLLDETDGRNAATRIGLRVTDVLGILLHAKRQGRIALLKPELDALRTQARFFVSGSLEQKVLQAAGELAPSE